MTLVSKLQIPCPYCQGFASYRGSSKHIYGRDYGPVYHCEPCDAYVGVHCGTTSAKGTPADFVTRKARKEAHAAFDPLWQTKKMSRPAAYQLMQRVMGMTPVEAHIGRLTAEQCNQLVTALSSPPVQDGGGE